MPKRDARYDPSYSNKFLDSYPPDWQARRKKVLQRDHYTCRGCGLRSTRVDDVTFDIDHIVAKSDGGTHDLENLQTLCRSCHSEKHPGNSRLSKRARSFRRRNKPSLIWRILRILLVFPVLFRFLASDGKSTTIYDEHGRKLDRLSLDSMGSLSDGTGVTIDVDVAQLWSSESDSVQQMGTLTDAYGSSEEIRFIVWSENGHPWLSQGRTYRLIGAKLNTYQGKQQIVADSKTAIEQI